MTTLEKNCYRYVLIGLGKGQEVLECTEPPCSPTYPGIAKSGAWQHGYVQIQPADPAKQFRPRGISAVDFASEELARFWMTSTAHGKDFCKWYEQVILVRVYNG